MIIRDIGGSRHGNCSKCCLSVIVNCQRVNCLPESEIDNLHLVSLMTTTLSIGSVSRDTDHSFKASCTIHQNFSASAACIIQVVLVA